MNGTELTQRSAPPPRRVWTQDVVVKAEVLRTRVQEVRASQHVAGSAPLDAARVEAVCDGVERLLDAAVSAAHWEDPKPSRWTNWWRGTLVEASYENLHAAEALLASLYSDDDVDAEVPEAVARIEAALHRDDPRRAAARSLLRMKAGPRKRAALRRAIALGYEAVDRRHAQVRSFRNIVLLTSAFVAALMLAVGVVLTRSPEAVPLCFVRPDETRVCPSGGGTASALDIWVVLLLGLLGGALAAAVSIRNIRGTSTPYDVPVALACLKVPAGAATAVAALVFIRGDFVPGLSELDSQEQILAYALVFGYAQQLLTKLIDQRAQDVLNSVPSKDTDSLPAQAPAGAWEVDEPDTEPVEQAGTTVSVPTARRPQKLPVDGLRTGRAGRTNHGRSAEQA